MTAAVNAAAIETENNALSLRGSGRLMNALRNCESSNCELTALRADVKRDGEKQNQRIVEACSGAGAKLEQCMVLSNSANQTAVNLLHATIYADTHEKKLFLLELVWSPKTMIRISIEN